MFDLKNKIAVVSGASRGIGRAIAAQLADEDVKVALVARTESELVALRDHITVGGRTAYVVLLDLALPEAPLLATEMITKELGAIDILVNNAAVPWPVGPTVECSIDEWTDALNLNLFAAVRLTHAVLPTLLKKGSGRIINLSSGAARPPGGIGQNAYSTAKAALEMFTLNLGTEIEGSGVTINALRPGATDTPMQTWMREQDPDKVGRDFHEIFAKMQRTGIIKDPYVPATRVIELLRSDDNGIVVEMVRRSEGGTIVDVENKLRSLG